MFSNKFNENQFFTQKYRFSELFVTEFNEILTQFCHKSHVNNKTIETNDKQIISFIVLI